MGPTCSSKRRVEFAWYVSGLLDIALSSWTYELGNTQLSAIEENVVVAFTAARTPDNTRLITILNHAYRVRHEHIT